MRIVTKPDDAPKLGEDLCFAIYSANLAFGNAYRPILAQLGLTCTQFLTMVALWEEGKQTVSNLGKKLFLESNTLTPILKKLEEKGVVRRQINPEDERQVWISLTRHGHRLRQRALDVDLVEATGLAPGEYATMRKAVAILRDNLLKSGKSSA